MADKQKFDKQNDKSLYISKCLLLWFPGQGFESNFG